MSFVVSGIPMVLIPNPRGPWLEGINPVTNLQWRNGVEPLLRQGAKYCLLESRHHRDFIARQFSDLNDVLDNVGRNNIRRDWDGQDVIELEVSGRGALAVFQWSPHMSPSGFDGDQRPVVHVSWYHAKGWTLSQGGLYLLTDDQWEWSAQGGERGLEYATKTGKLTGPRGKKLAHCSVRTREEATIDVDDPRYANGPFGLRHKTGNVWEWVERNNKDEFHPYSLRGGSWLFNNSSEILRVDFRYSRDPGPRGGYFGYPGFRVGAPVPLISSAP